MCCKECSMYSVCVEEWQETFSVDKASAQNEMENDLCCVTCKTYLKCPHGFLIQYAI